MQRLSNGNTFINSGGAPQSKAVEVTPDGEKVFQLSYPIGDITWRAFRFSQPAPPLFIVRLPGATSSFEFGGIYPNPAQNVATVIFSLQNAGDAEIDLLDVLGHTVRSIKEKILSAGSFSADLDVRDLAEGIYYCKLSQNGSISVKTIIVQK